MCLVDYSFKSLRCSAFSSVLYWLSGMGDHWATMIWHLQSSSTWRLCMWLLWRLSYWYVTTLFFVGNIVIILLVKFATITCSNKSRQTTLLKTMWKCSEIKRHNQDCCHCHLQNVIARPLKDGAGADDLFNWECAIPGPAKVCLLYTGWRLKVEHTRLMIDDICSVVVLSL